MFRSNRSLGRSAFVVLLLTAALISSCAKKQESAENATPAPDSTTTNNTATPTTPPLTDANIVAIVTAANDGQIDEGKAAKGETKNVKVRELAVAMITDHTSLNKQGGDLAKKLSVSPEENDVSKSIKASADSTVSALKALKGTDFDKAYVDHQVAEHQQVLDLLDNTLIPAAQNPDLKQLLQNARPIIAQHLDHAKQVQAALGTS